MTQLAEEKQVHVSNFARMEKASGNGHPSWIDALRRSGIEQFQRVGFPTTKDEEWRFTNVEPIAKVPFKLVTSDNRQGAEVANEFSFGQDAAAELVFINGQYA